MGSPVIAIPLRVDDRGGVTPRLYQNRAYFAALENAGAAVQPIPVTTDMDRLRTLYERCDGVCLPGGPDVLPSLYGEETRDDCSVDSNLEMDTVDLQLARWAVADDKPLLAICRGLQVLNVALGGTLWQDIAVQRGGNVAHPDSRPRDQVVHAVQATPGSRLAAYLGDGAVGVNSLHHQGVRQLAPTLTASAHSPDGVIEGVEHAGRRFVLGVQCHPEELYAAHPWAARLFHDFVVAAGA
jgi:putative glutamine amidotransferase